MFNSVALDVVIGLIFIYLLYSLFATILAEIIATQLGLRAFNLKEAVDRMLNDEEDKGKSRIKRVLDSLNIRKNPNNQMVKNFYNHPEIKYLGSTGVFKTPSSFKATSFSKTLLYALSGDGAVDKDRIGIQLVKLMNPNKEIVEDPVYAENRELAQNQIFKSQLILDKETARYVKNLWDDSDGSVDKFKLQLEAWFDRTMEQALEWYKRKIQFILMLIGFCMAWFFNADTIAIIHTLSKDDRARDQIVNMAIAYIQNNKPPVASAQMDSTVKDTALVDYNRKLDSLLQIKKELEKDISNANTVLGLGSWLPDSLSISIDPKTNARIYIPKTEHASLPAHLQTVKPGIVQITSKDKRAYFFNLFGNHFFGFLITAIAISLGAPFWFDLLNKLMKLRTSIKYETKAEEDKKR